jgi:hypothetical protein
LTREERKQRKEGTEVSLDEVKMKRKEQDVHQTRPTPLEERAVRRRLRRQYKLRLNTSHLSKIPLDVLMPLLLKRHRSVLVPLSRHRIRPMSR